MTLEYEKMHHHHDEREAKLRDEQKNEGKKRRVSYVPNRKEKRQREARWEIMERRQEKQERLKMPLRGYGDPARLDRAETASERRRRRKNAARCRAQGHPLIDAQGASETFCRCGEIRLVDAKLPEEGVVLPPAGEWR